MNLSVNIGSLTLKNPVMTASGTFGYGQEYAEFFDLSRLGAVVVKGISLKPMMGNPSPRICETPCGMINSIGLQNVGLENFLSEKLPYLRNFKTAVIVNVLGNSVEDYVEISGRLDGADIDAIELNVSCPNVKEGGMAFGTDPCNLEGLLKTVRNVVKHKTLIVKLSPNVSDIKVFAKIAEDGGADAVSLINTLTAMSIDIYTRRPRIAKIVGGLSGPAIKPVAVRMVWEVFKTVDIPIIGMGGIMNHEDAIEFILAGATAVAVGTANFIDPKSTVKIIEGLEDYLSCRNFNDIRDLIGGVIT
jgi:dihydroorotate dehydrogenase (NAD+) catalytic subunit